ncbi:MAG: circularly permuted type 2 ATP-grasp protein, partial [Bosea sp. (in: a-proteobacteria)]
MAAFDEMSGFDGATRDAYSELENWLKNTPPEEFATRRSQADVFFRRIGITFAVYGDEQSTERL